MNTSTVMMPVRTLRERMAEDMDLRRLSRATQRNYLRDVARFAMWLGRPPDTASGEELRQFQLDQREAGLGGPTLNSIVSALRFFYTHTIDRPDLTRKLYRVKHPRSLPTVLSREEVTRMLGATTSLKHQAILSVAYGAVCAPRRLPNSGSAMSMANACCSGWNAAKAVAIAMLCFRKICCLSCVRGGRRVGIRASCTVMAGCSRGSTISSLSVTGRCIVSRPRRHAPPASRSVSDHIRCDTASPLICSKTESISASSRRCSGTPS